MVNRDGRRALGRVLRNHSDRHVNVRAGRDGHGGGGEREIGGFNRNRLIPARFRIVERRFVQRAFTEDNGGHITRNHADLKLHLERIRKVHVELTAVCDKRVRNTNIL